MPTSRSWKTTLLGAAALLTTITKIATDPASLGAEDITAVVTAIGLIVAKDYNASHSARQ